LLDDGLRFEAGAYNIEARHAVEQMRAAGLPLVALYSEDGEALCHEAHNAFRFVRVWVAKERGYPFLSSADIISMKPDIQYYLSKKLTDRLDHLVIKKWDVLISCSGTIGNVSLASASFAGIALSQDAIRLRAKDAETAGYITAFLRCRFGRLQIVQATYGSVIKHIEPLHLQRIQIPEFQGTRNQIGSQVVRAYELRDEANKLLEEADSKLHALLKLSPLSDVYSVKSGPIIVRQRASKLSFRFDGSFHDAVAKAAEKVLRKSDWEIATLGDPRVTREIRPITKFRKRVYVPHGGIPLISSKQLMQIDPVDIKRLAKGAHTKDLPEIALNRDMVTVSRSGTIGRVQIIPAYMEGWAGSEHATRLLAGSEVSPGYLYAWLASDYGQRLLKRHSYGSVILEVDKEMIASVPIPLPPTATRNKIGDHVMRANELRDQAWRIEQDAIRELESLIESGSTRRPPRPV
jgi:type I restriction enzyme, S subunit